MDEKHSDVTPPAARRSNAMAMAVTPHDSSRVNVRNCVLLHLGNHPHRREIRRHLPEIRLAQTTR
jgi:hypothetical protein